MIFVADTADNVRRTLSMEQLFLCGASLLHMKSCACFVEEKFAQPEKQFCPTWTFLPVMWSKIGPHDKQLCSTLSVSSRFMLFWHKSPYCHSLRCFDALLILARFTQYCVEQQSTQKSCLCGAKMTNIMYANVLSINLTFGLDWLKLFLLARWKLSQRIKARRYEKSRSINMELWNLSSKIVLT